MTFVEYWRAKVKPFLKRACQLILFGGLFATSALANTIQLQWNRVDVPDVVGYYVFRSTTSGMYNFNLPLNTSPVPQPAAGPVMYTDTATNNTYFYVVKAVNALGIQSAPSNEATAGGLGPPAPGGLTVTSVTAALHLFVDKVQVAMGPTDQPLNYTIPRQTPPRSYAVLVTFN